MEPIHRDPWTRGPPIQGEPEVPGHFPVRQGRHLARRRDAASTQCTAAAQQLNWIRSREACQNAILDSRKHREDPLCTLVRFRQDERCAETQCAISMFQPLRCSIAIAKRALGAFEDMPQLMRARRLIYSATG